MEVIYRRQRLNIFPYNVKSELFFFLLSYITIQTFSFYHCPNWGINSQPIKFSFWSIIYMSELWWTLVLSFKEVKRSAHSFPSLFPSFCQSLKVGRRKARCKGENENRYIATTKWNGFCLTSRKLHGSESAPLAHSSLEINDVVPRFSPLMASDWHLCSAIRQRKEDGFPISCTSV